MKHNKTLIERIQERGRLTPSEAKIADFFERHHDKLAFETITSIGLKSGVSKATVTRFIASLGYASFADFQTDLQNELVIRLDPPIKRFPQMKETLLPDGENVLEMSFANIMTNLQRTYTQIDPHQFLEVAGLIAKSEGTVFITGQRSSYGLAHFFWVMLQYFRSRVCLLDSQVLVVPDRLGDITKHDLLVAITHQRYAKLTRQIVEYFADRSATVILLTDRKLMPYADYADYILNFSSEGVLMFNSLCAAFALLESLLIAVAEFSEKQAYDRSTINEKLFRHFETFCLNV